MLDRSPYSLISLDWPLLGGLWGICTCLMLINSLYLLLGSTLETLGGPLGYIIHQADLNREGNFATWFSSMLLLLNAFYAYLLGRGRWAVHRWAAGTSVLMALGFVVLSIDDFIGFHEVLEQLVAAGWQPARLSQASPSVSAIVLGPLLGIVLASVLIVLTIGPYGRLIQPENQSLLSISILCVLLVGLTEVVYNQAGELDVWHSWGVAQIAHQQAATADYWSFRLEVLIEESSELLASLLFLVFQSRELVASV